MTSQQETTYKHVRKLLKLGLDVVIDGSISNPQFVPDEGPCVLVSNHRSDLDPFLIMVNVRRPINWLGASYLWNIPFAGSFFDSIGAIPVSKFKSEIHRALDTAADCLREGQVVGIFPEGWNYIAENQFDWRVGEFQTGFARIAFQTGSPVVPMALVGLNEKRGVQMFAPWMRKLLDYPIELQYIKGRVVYRKLHINVGKPIPCPEGADPDDRDAVQAFTDKVNAAVKELYEQIPETVIGFENIQPVTAVEGMGRPLPEDEFYEDIVEITKMVRREIKKEQYDYDEEMMARLDMHLEALGKLSGSEDRNVREMAGEYIEWIEQVKHAAANETALDGKLEQFKKKYSH